MMPTSTELCSYRFEVAVMVSTFVLTSRFQNDAIVIQNIGTSLTETEGFAKCAEVGRVYRRARTCE
jgi:hypothetical protein